MRMFNSFYYMRNIFGLGLFMKLIHLPFPEAFTPDWWIALFLVWAFALEVNDD